MHDDAFDQVVRGLPRRRFLVLAGGLSGLMPGLPSAEARRRKRKKCKKGTSKCGKKCFNLKTDRTNCGACGNACPAVQVCSDGVCSCPADQSFIDGACIPRFGCTPDLDTCTVGKRICPINTNEADATCQVDANGQPFCGTSRSCVTLAPGGICTVAEDGARIFIPCTLCNQPGETGACVRPITQVRF